MAKLQPVIDAPFDLIVPVLKKHVEMGRRKASDTCGGETRNWGCRLEVAVLDWHEEFSEARADASVLRVKLWDPHAPEWRWLLDQDGKRMAAMNDAGREPEDDEYPVYVRLISAVATHQDEDGEVRMKRITRSIEWGRTEEVRQMKRESAERIKQMNLIAENYAWKKQSPEVRNSLLVPKKEVKRTRPYRDGREMVGFYKRRSNEDH